MDVAKKKRLTFEQECEKLFKSKEKSARGNSLVRNRKARLKDDDDEEYAQNLRDSKKLYILVSKCSSPNHRSPQVSHIPPSTDIDEALRRSGFTIPLHSKPHRGHTSCIAGPIFEQPQKSHPSGVRSTTCPLRCFPLQQSYSASLIPLSSWLLSNVYGCIPRIPYQVHGERKAAIVAQYRAKRSFDPSILSGHDDLSHAHDSWPMGFPLCDDSELHGVYKKEKDTGPQ